MVHNDCVGLLGSYHVISSMYMNGEITGVVYIM